LQTLEDDAAVMLLYVPGGQVKHVEWDVAAIVVLYVPAGHGSPAVMPV